ncbi:MAG: hypothetical protein ACTSQY_03735 [Candidatus Odinarchaeia archaeon]
MREKVAKVFIGEKQETVPLQIEIGDPALENIYSDLILVSGRIDKFNSFYIRGGPFNRGGNSRAKWAKTIELSSYQWPSKAEIVKDFELRIKNIIERTVLSKEKYRILKILGPTELAESFCSNKVEEIYIKQGQIYHQFNFAYLTVFNYDKATELHNKITEYITTIIKETKVIDEFDGIRIADDIFNYQGYLYPKEFIKNTWRQNHKKITQAIKARGCNPILHTDGNLIEEIEFINKYYEGLHPLDLTYKNSKKELKQWLSLILETREKTKLVFFTGIPINLLYGSSGKFNLLKEFIPNVIKKLKDKKFILSTTHRPYPTVNIKSEDTHKKYLEIRQMLNQALSKK